MDGGESVISLAFDSNHGTDVFERTKRNETKRKGVARRRTGKRIGTIYLVYRARHRERCINRLEDRLRAAILFHSIDRKVSLMTTGYLSLTRTTHGLVFNRAARSARAPMLPTVSWHRYTLRDDVTFPARSCNCRFRICSSDRLLFNNCLYLGVVVKQLFIN